MDIKYVFWLNFIQFLALILGLSGLAKTTFFVLNLAA